MEKEKDLGFSQMNEFIKIVQADQEAELESKHQPEWMKILIEISFLRVNSFKSLKI